MYLFKIAIRNFRAIESLEVELGPGLNVLIGENNVGKTTVLDALRIGLGAAAAGADALRMTSEDRRVGEDGRPVQDPVEVDVYFADLSVEEQAEFIDALNYDLDDPGLSTASIHFRWSYSEDTRRHHVRRWGGDRPEAEAGVPEDVLQGLPLTLLGALRDAVTALAPGRQSRLGRLLDASASDEDRAALESIALEANQSLDNSALILRAAESIRRTLKGASGTVFSQDAHIQTSEPEFDRIVNGLQLVLRLPGLQTHTGAPVAMGLKGNGLGFNNLLYIGTVMAELQATPTAQATLPLLLVEEPEAHLHPQLQTLLATYLAGAKPEGDDRPRVQTIVTTHSPTIAAHVPTEAMRVLHRGLDGRHRCVGLGTCGLTTREGAQLRRMFDVTRATLLFSRGVILVEGVAELLLVPILAHRLGLSLEEGGVAVIQVCGVDFKTIAKLFGPDKLEIPVSIVTDGDPGFQIAGPIPVNDKQWMHALPKRDGDGNIRNCDRTKGLLRTFATNPLIRVFQSAVTLEHALAAADQSNPKLLCSAWHSCYEGEPETFNRTKLAQCNDHEEAVLAVWRGICLASPAVTKGTFAQALAEELTPQGAFTPKSLKREFVVPGYLEQAILHALGLSPDFSSEALSTDLPLTLGSTVPAAATV